MWHSFCSIKSVTDIDVHCIAPVTAPSVTLRGLLTILEFRHFQGSLMQNSKTFKHQIRFPGLSRALKNFFKNLQGLSRKSGHPVVLVAQLGAGNSLYDVLPLLPISGFPLQFVCLSDTSHECHPAILYMTSLFSDTCHRRRFCMDWGPLCGSTSPLRHFEPASIQPKSAGWPAPLTANTFNQLISMSAVLVTGPTATQNSPFLPQRRP